MADGSGMSRESRFSPREFTAVLGYVFNAPFAEDFVDSLAVAGVDKLMRKRLTDPAHRGKVVAKTGTLDGVVSLSGFAFNRGGDILAFSIIANDTHGNWTARAIMDNICKALVDEKIDN
jgi:D-alanyl-D-alanine carboxypeptidase/D-alanyl-D-alanine-endopeptidase (penicillin-binding protein 4)